MATSPLPDDEALDTSPYLPPPPLPPPLPPPPPENPTPSAAAVPDSGDTTEATTTEKLRRQFDDLASITDQLEEKVSEVSEFYAAKEKDKGNNSKGSSATKDREKERALVRSGSNNNVSSLGCRKEAFCSKRMQEVMRQFGTIMRQAKAPIFALIFMSQHKWAWPFMQPVDVEGLHLDDYYEVIKKPMDFTTIRNRMEANGYKNVREIYADVRLVFTNAMTYNDDKSDVHVMAKTVLEKFEEKWLQLLPKVIEAETRQKEEESQAMATTLMAQEAVMAKMARDTNNELNELNLHLDGLRELVVQKCRKMSAEEKRKLGAGLSTLSHEDLNKALEIIAQDNPSFQATAEVVDLDMDAQNETTLWRLKFFVKGALELQAKNSASKADEILKRKVIYDALTARKRNKKLAS
ncbi:transcription factor GTE1-like [Iris pallida]|uniref:Transcription factor GTE1-like n=1 Tax=Iris pallida TaxID=29817 RepID=A0AAX6EST9_IRIPA|nr:transcription factor GTE1-like [Iris pallida]KAJ6807222.1 transcription factor GTE1-like [Iris pallida]